MRLSAWAALSLASFWQCSILGHGNEAGEKLRCRLFRTCAGSHGLWHRKDGRNVWRANRPMQQRVVRIQETRRSGSDPAVADSVCNAQEDAHGCGKGRRSPSHNHVSGTVPGVGKRILLHCMAFGHGGQAGDLWRHGFPWAWPHSRTRAVYGTRHDQAALDARVGGSVLGVGRAPIWMGEPEDAWASARLCLSSAGSRPRIDAIAPAADG
ncbi:hypothetical protein P171DRAFT_443208 [Karstenula rhodostoma CBS 690.94]|uniref:Uncharacterized protein n=1 Tax=Karstenula rhodostoma CBS 690.94 TaxID=1392251 RepID=A0A9P4UBG5_9PLEO|nr:hypothetical protein P171DRAFT_443208 [Karstenula rhodostoma CBS 690.94]